MQANITVIMTKQAVGGRPPRYASAPCKLTISSYLFARCHLFRHVGYLRHQQQVDLWPFDLESGIRVTCDSDTTFTFSALCLTLHSVPILVVLGFSVLDLGPMYATERERERQMSDRQTDVTQASLNASALWRRRHNKWKWPATLQTLHLSSLLKLGFLL